MKRNRPGVYSAFIGERLPQTQNRQKKKPPCFPSTFNLRRERNHIFSLLPCCTFDAEFKLFSSARRLTLASEWTDASCRLKAEDCTGVRDRALSDYFCRGVSHGILHNIDAMYRHYSRPYERKWRFRSHCVRQSALSNIFDELLLGCADVATHIMKNDMAGKSTVK